MLWLISIFFFTLCVTNMCYNRKMLFLSKDCLLYLTLLYTVACDFLIIYCIMILDAVSCVFLRHCI